MIIKLNNKALNFEEIPISFSKKDLSSVFGNKNNKTLSETLQHPKYNSLKSIMSSMTKNEMESPLGEILLEMKNSGDKRYLNFLNRYGDEKFCEFSINQSLSDNGIYCWTERNIIKYVGRCTDSLKKRVNYGYGKINPKNCFKDGQTTNCHLNSQIQNSRPTTKGYVAIS
jgi:hypothetical protein